MAIKSFAHKGLENFFLKGSKAGIQPHHADRLSRQLLQLNRATSVADMNVPGWRLHALGGKLADHYSVWVNGNYRMTFKFEGTDAILVDYQDYH
jgi:toxin HigB-1